MTEELKLYKQSFPTAVECLESVRSEIDPIDLGIVALLGEKAMLDGNEELRASLDQTINEHEARRSELTDKVGLIKAGAGLDIRQDGRFNGLLDRVIANARLHHPDVSEAEIREHWKMYHEKSITQQEKILEEILADVEMVIMVQADGEPVPGVL